MAIELDTTRYAAQLSASMTGEAAVTNTPAQKLSALLGGSSVMVTDASMTDLEALVARLKNENERTRFSMTLMSLVAVSQSLDESQKQRLEQGLALSEKLEELQKSLDKYSGEEAEAKAAMLLLQAKIDQLQKQIEQAVKDGKEHNKLVEEQNQAREELAAKEKIVAETQGQIAETKNAISSVKGQISALVSSIGENTLKAIAKDIAALAKPEDAERPAETEKTEAKEALNDPLNAIRESLERIERDLTEAIESNRIETV